MKLIPNFDLTGSLIWIGAADWYDNNTYYWMDGTPIDDGYTYWIPGYPMHMSNLVATACEFAWQWTDLTSDIMELYYLCEYLIEFRRKRLWYCILFNIVATS